MSLGLLGAIGGAGAGMQDVGKQWNDEAKQLRIEEQKQKWKDLDREDAQTHDVSMVDKRKEKESALIKERGEEARITQSERSAQTIAERQAQEDAELGADRARKEEGLLPKGSTPKPRSRYEGMKVYNEAKKLHQEQSRNRNVPFPDYHEWHQQNYGEAPEEGSTAAKPTNTKPSSDPTIPETKPTNTKHSSNQRIVENKDSRYGAYNEQLETLLAENGVKDNVLRNLRRRVSEGMSIETAREKLEAANYPPKVVVSMLAEIERSGN
jgi:hypothetical protein